MKNLVESYNVDADKVAAQVKIWNIKGESVPLYEIKMPVFGVTIDNSIGYMTTFI